MGGDHRLQEWILEKEWPGCAWMRQPPNIIIQLAGNNNMLFATISQYSMACYRHQLERTCVNYPNPSVLNFKLLPAGTADWYESCPFGSGERHLSAIPKNPWSTLGPSVYGRFVAPKPSLVSHPSYMSLGPCCWLMTDGIYLIKLHRLHEGYTPPCESTRCPTRYQVGSTATDRQLVSLYFYNKHP